VDLSRTVTVRRPRKTKLLLAYRLLLELAEKESDTSSHQIDFMRLPLEERRRIMAQQAEQMTAHKAYEDHQDTIRSKSESLARLAEEALQN